MKKYIVGVDGGNTKTDIFLFDTDCNLIDNHRFGTCSHEGLKDSFEGSYRVLKQEFDMFFERNNLKYSDIYASCFGLAGVDTPLQKEKMEEIIARLGFKNFIVVNDSFLGIKAGTTNGFGACSINGTGTSASSIDEDGSTMQVGGIGAIVGDEAGGHFIAREAIKSAYSYAYRFGDETTLYNIVMSFLNVTDKKYLMDAISYNLSKRIDTTYLVIKVFEEAKNGDNVAIQILKNVAKNLALSVGGSIVNLNFKDDVELVLAGSVWVKASNNIMIDEFERLIKHYTKKNIKLIVLKVPPATGAVIWALEIAKKCYPTKEEKSLIIKNVERILALL